MRNIQSILKKQISVSGKKSKADLVIKNGCLVDVFNLEIMQGDIAIVDGMIVGIGDYDGHEIIDAENRYICPGLIDGHVHIESSMVTPSEYAKVVLPHGVTTVITDPHEIANVSGTKGIQYMLHDSEHIPLDVFFMLPSCVPATAFENSGAVLKAEDLEGFYQHQRVLGLAEVMDYPAVRHPDTQMLDKLVGAHSKNKPIDGHGAGFDIDGVNVYRAAGILTDHECTTATEALDRLRRGMYVIIREGSASRDLDAVIKVVTDKNSRRCLFCTDDKHLDDIIKEGTIDYNIRRSIAHGVDPLIAVQMATINAAECYGLKNKGAIAPGYVADFLFIDDLQSFNIVSVYKSGNLVAENGKYLGESIKRVSPGAGLTETVHAPNILLESLRIPMNGGNQAHIIEIIPNQIVTNKRIEAVPVQNDQFVPSTEKDLLKLVVVERHQATGNVGVGIVRGFGLKKGAVATTIAHDSHNIVAMGTNDEDIIRAIEEIKDMNGGLVAVKNGTVIASLVLEVGGLMSMSPHEAIAQDLGNLNVALVDLGFPGGFNPFLTLSFLTLPVIPSLKLTDQGLFDVESFKFIDVVRKNSTQNQLKK